MLVLMLAVLAAILTAAMVMQYAFGEIPCPLCLLQRVAMFGCCFGLIEQLRSSNSERGTGIALIFAVLLLVISVRQTLLDLFPRPGHDYVGSASSAFTCRSGRSLSRWRYCSALQSGWRCSAVRGMQRMRSALYRAHRSALVLYVIAICAINFLSVIAQCGLDQCHTFGYRLLQ